MWSNSSWQPWPQQAMYQNVPHEQVDWAALAKQWIQMREQTTRPSPPNQSQNGSSGLAPALSAQVPSTDPDFVEGNSGTAASFWNNSWGTPAPPLPGQLNTLEAAAPVGSSWNASSSITIPVTSAGAPAPKETFDYGHVHNTEPLTAQSFEYNHGTEFNHATPTEFVQPVVTDYGHVSSTTDYGHGQAVPVDQFAYSEIYPPEPSYCQYWPQTEQGSNVVGAPPPPPPPFLKKDRSSRNEHQSPRSEEESTQIDATKRKQLPAWIREGLEKMERERQRKMEKEMLEKGLSQNTKSDSNTEHIVKASNDTPEITLSPNIMQKSKFDTESEEEEEKLTKPVRKKAISPTPSPPRQSSSPTPVYTMTEEERMANMMLKVRRILTEILLEVTNEEIAAISKEVYQKALAKAPARQLATSSALASITGGLGGLADYGTDSEKESEEEREEDENDSTSDEELQRRIDEKQRAFALREREIIAALDKEEALEQEKEKQKEASRTAKQKSENVHLHKPAFLLPTPENEDEYGGNKVQIIPGLDINPEVKGDIEEKHRIVKEQEPLVSREPLLEYTTKLTDNINLKILNTKDKENSLEEIRAKSSESVRLARVEGDESSKNRAKRSSRSSSRDKSSDSSSDSHSKERYDKDHKYKHKHKSKDRKKRRSRSRSRTRSRSPGRRRRSRSRSYDRYRSSRRRPSKYRSPSRSPSYSRQSSKRKKKDEKYRRRRSRSYSYSPKRSRSRSADSERLGKKSSGKHWDR